MSILNQKTVKHPISFVGIGLHNGKKVKIVINPAQPNSGITFKRVDLKKDNVIIPSFENVANTALNTTVSNEYGVKVSTIEHLMGALLGVGVDNALIEIDNEEVPILDGSAKDFIDKIRLTGFDISNVPIKIIKINKKIEFTEGNRFISMEPSKLSLDIDFEIKYDNETIGSQRNKVDVYQDDLQEIFSSRTFCLYEDIELIKSKGLAKGGSLDNAIVVKENEILNKDKLRNPLEFVNHKILDCIGDLFTSGYRIVASVYCTQGGHYMTNQLLKKVFENKENFSILEIKEKTLPHTLINKNNLRSIA